MRWSQLEPDPAMLRALDAAGPRPSVGTSDKRNWGTRFADACAVFFADAVRANAQFAGLEIRPNPDGSGRESLTGVGGRGRKKVDVIASTLASGLQLAISLKAENFPTADGTFGKNLTNRVYELQDEVRAIHEYQPQAYVLAVFFLPLEATNDKSGKWSSFARTVAQLRARSGRTDLASPTQYNKLDRAAVALYAADGGDAQRGVVRYFDVHAAPPRVGRPQVDTTMSLEALVSRVAADFERDSGGIMEFAEPEPE